MPPWSLDVEEGGDFSKFVVLEGGKPVGTVKWSLLGAHNAENALAAIGAARHAGVPVSQSIAALGGIQGRETPHGAARRGAWHRGVRRFRASPHGHRLDHRRPAPQGRGKRIVAVLEPRSATMRMGVHRETLAPSLAAADSVWMFAPPDLGWDADAVVGIARVQGPAGALGG